MPKIQPTSRPQGNHKGYPYKSLTFHVLSQAEEAARDVTCAAEVVVCTTIC